MNNNQQANTLATCIVIFGGTGDLAIRSLYPSIFSLHQKNLVREKTTVIAYAHTAIDTEELRDRIRNRLVELDAGNTEDINHFVGHVHFQQGSFDMQADYDRLAQRLESLGCIEHTNRLFYLATPPRFFAGIFTCLGSSDMARSQSEEQGWVRVGVEKPFGSDMQSAQELDSLLHTYFNEQQVYHVDHFLNKELTSSLLFFRFANAIFAPAWNNQYVSKIDVVFDESLDVAKRGPFYDKVGAFLDVGQNHALALLSFVLMDTPAELTAQEMGPLRARALSFLSADSAQTQSYQYDGFRDITGVSPDSTTETYFNTVLYSTDDKWSGVPMHVRGGKGVDQTEVSVSIYFEDKNCLPIGQQASNRSSNVLQFVFKPDARIVLSVWDKETGIENNLEPVDFVLPHNQRSNMQNNLLNTYERVLWDIIRGEHTLFLSESEIMASWKLSDAIGTMLQQTIPVVYKLGTHPIDNKI